MSEPAPAAPAAEPVAPTTPEPAVAPAPEPSAPADAPAAPTTPEQQAYFTPEQLKEMETFYRNNGGFEKVFGATKNIISRPQDYAAKPAQTPPEAPQQPQMGPQPSAQPEGPQTPPAGTYSMEEMAALSYFDRLAGMKEYEAIADEIRSGEVLTKMKDFHISPLRDGRINDGEVRKFLDLYKMTKPPVPTSATPAADSQFDYLKIDKVTTREEADKIQLQSLAARAKGLPPHPAEEAAKTFLKEYYKGKK